VDPLTHMVRNSVDHGIESVKDRLSQGKDEQGQVELSAYPKGGFFYIELKDDGKGLDVEKIRDKAISKGIITPNSNLSDNELYQLIFRSGFSTNDAATDISGRGVGMDVVKRSIEKLKGNIEIYSEKGKGTTFSIKLPLSLAIFNGMVTKVGEEKYIFSNSDIDEALRIDTEKIVGVDSSSEMIELGDDVYPLINLDMLIHKKRNRVDKSKRKIVYLTKYENKKYAILVDEIISQQRVVYKDLGQEADDHPTVSGGTILGDGGVCLIMDCSKIIEQYKKVAS